MALFARNFHQPADAAFTPFFRLLSDFDSHSRRPNGACAARRPAVVQWQPKFDIRETAETYELYGELPGIDRENIHIEFSDPQTLTIRGRNERTYTAGTSPTARLETAPVAPVRPVSPTNVDELKERRSSHQATVEDEDNALERESGYEVVANDDKADGDNTEKRFEEKSAQKPADKAKYWLTERSIGEFLRSFNFPSRVEQDSVTASLQNGVLSITVVKEKKHEAFRININ